MPTNNDPMGRVWLHAMKRCLQDGVPARSGHVDEALAAGWGFRNHGAYLARHKAAPPQPPAPFDIDALDARLAELGGKGMDPNMLNEVGIMFADQGYRVTRVGGAEFVPERDWLDALQLEIQAPTGLDYVKVDAALSIAWGFEPRQALPASDPFWPPLPTHAFDAGAFEDAMRTMVRAYPDGLAAKVAAAMAKRGYRVTRGGAVVAGGDPPAATAPWLAETERDAARLLGTSTARVAYAMANGWGYRYDVEWRAGFVGGQPPKGKPFDATKFLRLLAGVAGPNQERIDGVARVVGRIHDEGYAIVDDKGKTLEPDEDGDDEPPARPKPPPLVPFVPRDGKRPRLVAEALRQHFGSSQADAQKVAAMLYGHETWAKLQKAVARGPADKPDEEAGAEETQRRAAFQAKTLEAYSSMGPVSARRAIGRLSPTGSRNKPTLRGFAEEEADMLFQDIPGMGDPFGGEALRSFAKRIGIDLPEGTTFDDMMDGFRVQRPVRGDAWLAMLADQAGWEILAPQRRVTEHGKTIGAVADPETGEAMPIYLSAIAYRPGDHGDKQAEALRQEIQDQGLDKAIVVYDVAMMIRRDDGNRHGMLYLGQMLRARRWHDVWLPPGRRGVAAIVAQAGRDGTNPDEAFVAEFGGGNDAIQAMVRSLDKA